MHYVKGARVTLGLTSVQVAEQLGLSKAQYNDRERGRTKFSDDEKIKLSKILGWTPEEMNKYLYDGKLPIDDESEW